MDDFNKDGVKKLYSIGLNDFADKTTKELSFQTCFSKGKLAISTTERNSSSETDPPDFTNENYISSYFGLRDRVPSVVLMAKFPLDKQVRDRPVPNMKLKRQLPRVQNFIGHQTKFLYPFHVCVCMYIYTIM